MTWNYRVLAKKEIYRDTEEIYFEIHSVYYDENGVPNGYSSEPEKIGSETLKGINWTLNKMKTALKKEILWGDEKFPQIYVPE